MWRWKKLIDHRTECIQIKLTMQCISSKVQCCSLIFSSSLSEPSLFFINVSDPIRTFLSHFYHISIIFYICKIYHISVCEYWICGYLWEKNEGHWTKKSGDVFFFRIKVKVRILRKTKQNNRSTLFFFTVALTLFHTYQRIYYMIIL